MSTSNPRCRVNGKDLGILISLGENEPTCELVIPRNEDPHRRVRIDRVIQDDSTWLPWLEILVGKPGGDPPEEPEDSRTIALVKVPAFATYLTQDSVG